MSYKMEENDEHMNEDNEEEYEEPEDPNESAIRLGISQTPFEELLNLSDKLGTKRYNETIVSKIDTNFAKNKSKRNDNSFKRVNKNRPQEISSKRPVNQVREVFQIKKNKDIERRDPRFEEGSGRFSESVFSKTYGFLNDIRDKETNELKKMLKKTVNEEKKQELKYLLQRIKNQKTSEQMKQNRKELETNVRNKLSEETGSKNTFVNKSTLKRLELVEKYKQLKKSGKLKQYLEKKRKRNATRERKKRDPRFEEGSGRFSESVFSKTYGFLNDIRDKETNELKKMLKKTANEEKKQELKYLLQRIKNQKTSEQMKQNRKELETNVRNKLNEETGSKNTFVNKSTLKRLELVEKYKQLKKSGKLRQYLEKKRKRNATRERKKFINN
ncbi:unnamed protein product [Medioppia subpectinata]|uniref:rRNA biogenesis protein RRP36 n=1 Tax=Medioppia subpectinata TaxID=1979941 RepID=A0A7R9KYZ1_9ACAR|nr:unnamed protein product [Medioppia subpectinata]CAG2112151.1 unnamed protein product [Medioppia subpectinata]